MNEDNDRPEAEHVSVTLGRNTDTHPIKVDGEALLIKGYHQARVSLRIGDQDASISVTLSPSDARALRDELDEGVDEARDEVERWLDRDDFRRY